MVDHESRSINCNFELTQPKIGQICNAQFRCFIAVGIAYMSAFDWRSEAAYDKINQAEAIDIAWEWLRRFSEYKQGYAALAADQRSSAVGEDFGNRWGLSFRS